MKQKILELIEKNSRLSVEEMAVMLGIDQDELVRQLKELEEDKTILGYHTMINWDHTDREMVTALIEVKVTPQKGLGFDKIAERIYQYPEVNSVYLMSGGFDLTVIIEAKTMKEIAFFVAEKLAVLDGVMSTSTHFVLKKYKQNGFVFVEDEKDQRAAIWL